MRPNTPYSPSHLPLHNSLYHSGAETCGPARFTTVVDILSYSILLSSLVSTQNQTTLTKHTIISRLPSTSHINVTKFPTTVSSLDVSYDNYFSSKSIKSVPRKAFSAHNHSNLANNARVAAFYTFLHLLNSKSSAPVFSKKAWSNYSTRPGTLLSAYRLTSRRPLLVLGYMKRALSKSRSLSNLSHGVSSSRSYYGLPGLRRNRLRKVFSAGTQLINPRLSQSGNIVGFNDTLTSNLYASSTYLSMKPGLLNSILDNPCLLKLPANRNLIETNYLNLSQTSAVNNLVPSSCFNKLVVKNLTGSTTSSLFTSPLEPWVNNTLLRFIENCTGKMVMINYSPQVNNIVDSSSMILYKRWLLNMSYYEKRMGHRFFLEEALHILHLGFKLHDPKIISSWLKAMIKRISFWKTRSIFRFLKYLFNNYFSFYFDKLNVKGFKLKLKGKISSAGNSRKRLILFRSGKTSYSNYSIKCLHDVSTVSTFTGVMGFQLWIFY